jgi:hypothetical protein
LKNGNDAQDLTKADCSHDASSCNDVTNKKKRKRNHEEDDHQQTEPVDHEKDISKKKKKKKKKDQTEPDEALQEIEQQDLIQTDLGGESYAICCVFVN